MYFLFLSLSVIARCFVSFILVQFFFTSVFIYVTVLFTKKKKKLKLQYGPLFDLSFVCILLYTSTNCFNFGSWFVSSSDLRLFIVVGFSPVVGHYCFCSEEEEEEEEEEELSFPHMYICNLAFLSLLLGLQLCCCVLYICIFSSSLYLWLPGALSVLFWYSFPLHLCLCYSFVYLKKKKKKKNKKKNKNKNEERAQSVI